MKNLTDRVAVSKLDLSNVQRRKNGTDDWKDVVVVRSGWPRELLEELAKGFAVVHDGYVWSKKPSQRL